MTTTNKECVLDPIITTFQGRDKTYIVEAYNSGALRNGFMGVPEYRCLVETGIEVYLQTYPDRNKEMSIERVKKILSHPRTILELLKHEDIAVGLGVFPRLFIEGDHGLYSSRAIVAEHERQGGGVYILDRAMELHNEELARSHNRLRWGALMTQNPASIVSLQRAPKVKDIHPFLRLDGRYEPNSKAQRIMLAVHNWAMMNSRSINTLTGVSKSELWEVGMNENYRPDRESSTWEIYQEMVGASPEGLEMNREGGDVVYVTYEITTDNGTSGAAA